MLPRTPNDVIRLRWKERLLYVGAIALARLTGAWRYPMQTTGDIERMRTNDKIYWLYKTTHPIRRAPRRSGLERFFAQQDAREVRMPPSFSPEAEVTISAAGDLITHPFLSHSHSVLYGDVAELIFGADIAMANLECAVLDRATTKLEFSTRSGPSLSFTTAEFDVVSAHGTRQFDFLATACNHSLDFGEEGVDTTIAALRERRIAFNGTNASEDEAARAAVVERNGIRVGVIAHTFGLNGLRPPAKRPRIVNRTALNSAPESADLSQIAEQIAWCRRNDIDFIVAHLHWGLEHEFYPRPEQVSMAHRLAEMGVDTIIGHHPHVIQPVEYYRTERDPDRVVPIYYSLGNLVNGFSADYLCRGLVARLELVKGRTGAGEQRTYLGSAKAIEIRQEADESSGTIAIRVGAGSDG